MNTSMIVYRLFDVADEINLEPCTGTVDQPQ